MAAHYQADVNTLPSLLQKMSQTTRETEKHFWCCGRCGHIFSILMLYWKFSVGRHITVVTSNTLVSLYCAVKFDDPKFRSYLLPYRRDLKQINLNRILRNASDFIYRIMWKICSCDCLLFFAIQLAQWDLMTHTCIYNNWFIYRLVTYLAPSYYLTQ